MKPLHLAAMFALTTVCGMANAQSAPNPFSRPQPVLAPPVSGMPTGMATPDGLNRQGNPTAPLGAPPMAAQPPGLSAPSTSPMPFNDVPSTVEEEVPASRVGTVNGMRIYRGDGTYVFEKADDKKLVRRVVPAQANPTRDSRAKAAPNSPVIPPSPRDLPSMVGKPAPKS